MIDKKKIALIHIIKKNLGLSDRAYRAILQQAVGVRSSKDLDDALFRKLMHYFVRSNLYKVNSYGLTVKQKMYIDHLVRELNWSETHFFNFLKKYYHKRRVEWLSKKDASKVIEALKRIYQQQ